MIVLHFQCHLVYLLPELLGATWVATHGRDPRRLHAHHHHHHHHLHRHHHPHHLFMIVLLIIILIGVFIVTTICEKPQNYKGKWKAIVTVTTC